MERRFRLPQKPFTSSESKYLEQVSPPPQKLFRDRQQLAGSLPAGCRRSEFLKLLNVSKYPPAEPGVLFCEPLKAVLALNYEPPKGGRKISMAMAAFPGRVAAK
jgi:hypothetical protein